MFLSVGFRRHDDLLTGVTLVFEVLKRGHLQIITKMATYLEQMQKHFQINCKTKEYPVHSHKVHSVAWNCDGKRLASGSFDKTVVSFVINQDRLVYPSLSLMFTASVYSFNMI